MLKIQVLKIYLLFGPITDQDFAEDIKNTSDRGRETPPQRGKYKNMINGYLMVFIVNVKPVPLRVIIDWAVMCINKKYKNKLLFRSESTKTRLKLRTTTFAKNDLSEDQEGDIEVD